MLYFKRSVRRAKNQQGSADCASVGRYRGIFGDRKNSAEKYPPPSHQKLLADFEKLDATAQKAVSQMIETLAAR